MSRRLLKKAALHHLQMSCTPTTHHNNIALPNITQTVTITARVVVVEDDTTVVVGVTTITIGTTINHRILNGHTISLLGCTKHHMELRQLIHHLRITSSSQCTIKRHHHRMEDLQQSPTVFSVLIPNVHKEKLTMCITSRLHLQTTALLISTLRSLPLLAR